MLPFGLKNAAQTFQRFIHEITRDMPFVFAYLDDILVASHLRTIFTRLREYNIQVNFPKCVFAATEVPFLGYMVSPEGVRPLEEQVKFIREYPQPNTVKGLRRFPGVINFYSYSLLAAYLAIKHFRFFTRRTQLRQLDFISQFTTHIVYIPGRENVVADAYLRIESVQLPSSISLEDIRKAQEKDDELVHLRNSTTTSLNFQDVALPDGNITVDNSTGVLKPYIPLSYRKLIFDSIHNLAQNTTKVVESKYVWPSINKDCRAWARACIPCQRSKVTRHMTSAIGNYPPSNKRFEHVNIEVDEIVDNIVEDNELDVLESIEYGLPRQMYVRQNHDKEFGRLLTGGCHLKLEIVQAIILATAALHYFSLEMAKENVPVLPEELEEHAPDILIQTGKF
ncbi:hypothetical protein Trydic_g295 [Trypoxylus dichotomus]